MPEVTASQLSGSAQDAERDANMEQAIFLYIQLIKKFPDSSEAAAAQRNLNRYTQVYPKLSNLIPKSEKQDAADGAGEAGRSDHSEVQTENNTKRNRWLIGTTGGLAFLVALSFLLNVQRNVESDTLTEQKKRIQKFVADFEQKLEAEYPQTKHVLEHKVFDLNSDGKFDFALFIESNDLFIESNDLCGSNGCPSRIYLAESKGQFREIYANWGDKFPSLGPSETKGFKDLIWSSHVVGDKTLQKVVRWNGAEYAKSHLVDGLFKLMPFNGDIKPSDIAGATLYYEPNEASRQLGTLATRFPSYIMGKWDAGPWLLARACNGCVSGYVKLTNASDTKRKAPSAVSTAPGAAKSAPPFDVGAPTPGAPRKVKTLTVRPDGTIQATAPQATNNTVTGGGMSFPQTPSKTPPAPASPSASTTQMLPWERTLPPSPAPEPPAANKFTRYNDKDLPGNDISIRKGTTLLKCESECMRLTNCLAYTFNVSVGWCFFKNRVDKAVIFKGAVSGVKR